MGKYATGRYATGLVAVVILGALLGITWPSAWVAAVIAGWVLCGCIWFCQGGGLQLFWQERQHPGTTRPSRFAWNVLAVLVVLGLIIIWPLPRAVEPSVRSQPTR